MHILFNCSYFVLLPSSFKLGESEREREGGGKHQVFSLFLPFGQSELQPYSCQISNEGVEVNDALSLKINNPILCFLDKSFKLFEPERCY